MGKAAKFLLLLAGRFVGLLNQYSGAAAAYSLRSLSTSTTNVVKVRRSGDDAELDFTAEEVSDGTLEAWVVAGGGTDDGFVTTWYDQSGNGNNATQATAANQPKIVDSGTLVTENGKAAVEFDGTDDSMNITMTSLSTFTNLSTFYLQTQSLAAAANANTQSLMVIGEGGNTYDGMSFSQSTGVLNDEYFCMYFRNTNDVNTQGRLGSSTYTRSANTQEILSLFNLSSGTSIFTNASQMNLDLENAMTVSTNTSPSNMSLTSDVIIIGKSYSAFTQHTTQEIIIYPSDQSANRTGIEANINDYYNIYP